MKREDGLAAISKISELLDRLPDDSTEVTDKQVLEALNTIRNCSDAAIKEEIYFFE